MRLEVSTVALALMCALPVDAQGPPNVLLITVDDMNWDSVGVYGAEIPNLTPNIDRLAREGLRFEHAHVTIAICQPTRAVWMTGRYPHNSGAFGFEEIRPDVPTLVEALRDAGFRTGLMAKHGHVVPSRAEAWTEIVPAKELANGRSPELYYERALRFMTAARDAEQPFFLMANSQDPHRPFAGSADEATMQATDAESTNHQYGGGFPPVESPSTRERFPSPVSSPISPTYVKSSRSTTRRLGVRTRRRAPCYVRWTTRVSPSERS